MRPIMGSCACQPATPLCAQPLRPLPSRKGPLCASSPSFLLTTSWNRCPRLSNACGQPYPPRTCWWWTTTAPTAPGSWRTASLPRIPRSMSCTARARKAWAPPTSPGSSGASTPGYDVLVEMDADGSHQPEQLPQLLDAVEQGADLAMGSRWVPGGSVVNWPLYRQAISRDWQHVRPADAGPEDQGRHRRLPRVPEDHAGKTEPRPGRFSGLRLPGGPGVACRQDGPQDRGAPHHVRRA